MSTDSTTYGDALSQPFWEAAARHELVVQRCADCDAHQFYPRPYCLACQSDRVEWVATAGTGTIYTLTTIHLKAFPDHEPPYVCAVVELDEGPRLMTNIVGEGSADAAIGNRVRVGWRERDGLPPVAVFEVARSSPHPPAPSPNSG